MAGLGSFGRGSRFFLPWGMAPFPEIRLKKLIQILMIEYKDLHKHEWQLCLGCCHSPLGRHFLAWEAITLSPQLALAESWSRGIGGRGRDVKEIVKKCPPAPVTHVRLSGCQDERQAWNRAETVPWPGYSSIIIDLSQTEVHCCFDIALMWGIESKIAGQGSTSCSILPWCQSANLDNS